MRRGREFWQASYCGDGDGGGGNVVCIVICIRVVVMLFVHVHICAANRGGGALVLRKSGRWRGDKTGEV